MILKFEKTNQCWIDIGLIGLYKLSSEIITSNDNINIELNEQSVNFIGEDSNIEQFLKRVYDVLSLRYYNVSTQKQIEENMGFYYNTEKDEFIRFPKAKPIGIASLIFSKKPVPLIKQIKYIDNNGTLPSEFLHIQERHDDFVKNNNLNLMKNLLINGRNIYKPSVDIIVIKKNKKKAKNEKCLFCGSEADLNGISSTVFPLITGSSGILSFFHGGKSSKVCWKCNFVTKFVPVLGFYILNDNNYNMYFPYSSSLEKISNIYDNLNPMKLFDDKLQFRNFEHELGGYFQKSSENLFTFLYSIYRIIPEGDNVLDDIFELYVSKSPLEICVFNMKGLGKSFVGKNMYNFSDTIFVHRLLHFVEKENGINIIDVMRELVDYDTDKNDYKTITRDKICERILNKQSIVDLVEEHVYNVKSLKYFKPLLDFTIIYEKIIKEDNMRKELIDIAVGMGKRIGRNVKDGDLYKLRKSRTNADFLAEISRIQLRYNMLIEADIYNRGEEISSNFKEFKQFFIIAAKNSLNAKNKGD